MEIRFAKPEDTLAILKLLEQIGKVHYDLRPDIFQSHAQKYGASQVLDRLANPETPTFVAVEGEKVLGYSFCEMKVFHQHPVMKDRKEMFLEDLCVDESARGQGIGKALYEALEKILALQNILNLNACIGYPELEDEHLTKNSVQFHERMGYRFVGEFYKCGYKFGRWYNMVWMEKHIGEHPDVPLSVKRFDEIRKTFAENMQFYEKR